MIASLIIYLVESMGFLTLISITLTTLLKLVLSYLKQFIGANGTGFVLGRIQEFVWLDIMQ